MDENNTLEAKILLLKDTRLQFLRLHKLLIDIEKENYEKLNGKISSGQFLNLLLNEPSLQWLRRFSMLIVEIDEMLDLDDGFTEEMLENHLSQMREIVELQTSDDEFNDNYKKHLRDNGEVAGKHAELKTMLSKN